MAKRPRKTSPAKAADQDHAGLTAWANIAVVANKFQHPRWPDLLQRCDDNRIASEANDWLWPIIGSMKDLFGEIVWQPRLLDYLRRVHGINTREALAMPLRELADLLWQDAQQLEKGTSAPPAVWAEIEAGLDAYMGDWTKSLLDHLDKQRPEQTPATAAKKQTKKRGRPKESNADADRQIAEAWGTGRYPKYADLERELNQSPGDVGRAIDRHKKRERRANQ